MAPAPRLPESHSLLPEYTVLILPQTLLPQLGPLIAHAVPVFDVQNAATTTMPTAAHLHIATSDLHQYCLRLNASQLITLEDISINGATSFGEAIPGPPLRGAGQMPTPQRRKVKTACVNCREAGKRCDPGRPCSRCRKKHLPGCRDAPTKRRKLDYAGNSDGTLEYPQVTASSSRVSIDQVFSQLSPPSTTPLTSSIPAETISSSIHLPNPTPEQSTTGAEFSEGYPDRYTLNGAGAMGQAAYTHGDPAQALTVHGHAIAPIAAPLVAEYPSAHNALVAPMVVPPYHFSQNEVGSWTNEGLPAGGSQGVGSEGFEAAPESNFQSSASDHPLSWGQWWT